MSDVASESTSMFWLKVIYKVFIGCDDCVRVVVFVGCVYSLAGYPPFSPDRSDKPMQQQILTGDYQHYMREKFWDDITDDGSCFSFAFWSCCI